MSTPEKKSLPSKAFESGLYIVATPIGNLGDISARACDILAAADLVAVEDSRVTGKLLNHLGLKKRMLRHDDYAKSSNSKQILDMARDGVVALVSDAGTPLISDPGYRIVRAAREADIPVYGVPGASAAITALSISGLPTDRFLFAGFLPAKDKARRDMMQEFAGLNATLVFYESGPRLAKTLAAANEIFARREVAIARELTKKFEEVVTGSLTELTERYAHEEPKGEIVLMIGPPSDNAEDASETDIDAALAEALKQLPPAKAAKEIAKRVNLDRSEVYARAMEMREQ